jgi:trimeric autotransporter adhesin
MHIPRSDAKLALLSSLFVTSLLVSACGGGGSDAPPPPPPPAPVKVSGVVADGPLRGAIACYDLNDNRACDTDEPKSAATDADGNYSIDVPAAEAGKHAVVVNVPADAVDKDTGAAVGAAYALIAPSSGNATAHSVFVSPLTTLVVNVAQQQNVSTAAATDQVKGQLGMTASPLANFVSANDAQAAKLAATVNAVIVDISKLAVAANVSAANTQALINAQTIGNLPALGAQVAAAPASATPAQLAQMVSTAVLAAANVSTTTVAAVATATAQIAAPLQVLTPGPFISPRRFSYTDANNYFMQLFVGDSSKTDASGVYLAHEVRKTQTNGADVPFNRNRAYWTGAAWQVCNQQWEIVATTNQTTTMPQKSVYCGGSKSESRITSEDISGKKMADVVAAMRAYPLADSDGLPTKWGPDPALLGDAVFPAGSSLTSRAQLNEVGNTDNYGLLDKVVWRYADGSYRHLADFDADTGAEMEGNMRDASATVTGANAVFLDEYAVPQPADTTLRAVARFLVAFGDDNPSTGATAVRFYKCNVIAATGGERDCAAVGDGVVSGNLETKGGRRIARFASGYPAELLAKTHRQRFFIESDGTVFRGTTDLQRTVYSQRMNTVAWVALRDRLGLAAHSEPTAPAGPGPFITLRNFTFTDINNYSLRAFTGDSSVLDAEGYFLANEVRETKTNGVLQPYVRNRLYWTGSEWFNCGDAGLGINRINSKAPFDSSYCKSYNDDRFSNASVTLDGRRMSDVVRDIRRYGSKDGTFDYRNWGPDPNVHTALANAFFPAGSRMEYRGNTEKAKPVSIATAAGDQVRVPPADASVPFNAWPFAESLDEFIGKYAGDVNGGPLNGATAFFVYSYNLPAPAAPEYSNNVQIRVAFDAAGQKARFYRNYRFASNGFTTAYERLLDTTYTIETIGGLKVMKFAAMPAGFETEFRFKRLFAERNGGVWYAFQDYVSPTPVFSIRLNGPAAQALTAALGI